MAGEKVIGIKHGELELAPIRCPKCGSLLKYGDRKEDTIDPRHTFICTHCDQDVLWEEKSDKLHWSHKNVLHVTTPKRWTYEEFVKQTEKFFSHYDEYLKEKEYIDWKLANADYLERYKKEILK